MSSLTVGKLTEIRAPTLHTPQPGHYKLDNILLHHPFAQMSKPTLIYYQEREKLERHKSWGKGNLLIICSLLNYTIPALSTRAFSILMHLPVIHKICTSHQFATTTERIQKSHHHPIWNTLPLQLHLRLLLSCTNPHWNRTKQNKWKIMPLSLYCFKTYEMWFTLNKARS